MTHYWHFETIKNISSSSGRLKLYSLDGRNMLDSTSYLSCEVPTFGKLLQLRVCHNKNPVLAIAIFFLLMFTIYLMVGLKLNFNSSHVEYFRKKIAVDIFNDDIVL